jgi:hypothetical protein
MFTCNYRASANSFTSLCLPCHAVNSSGSSVIAYSASEYNTRFWSMSLELIWEKSFRVPCSCVVESTFFMECGMQKCCTGTNCGTGEAAFMYWGVLISFSFSYSYFCRFRCAITANGDWGRCIYVPWRLWEAFGGLFWGNFHISLHNRAGWHFWPGTTHNSCWAARALTVRFFIVRLLICCLSSITW